MIRAWAAAGAVALAFLGGAPAVVQAAGPPPVRGLSDGRLLANDDPALRAGGIEVARRVGAGVARIPLGWTSIVRNESFVRPDESRIKLSDPANPTYDWSRIDASLRSLAAAGLTPIAYFLSAPPWAQAAPRYVYAREGTWAPRPADLADFASAVARRYDGSYPDPLAPGHALPRLSHFQTWNEPNLALYLQPQWVGVGGHPSLYSARWYRRMHEAAYAAIHARQPAAQVALAGLAPNGSGSGGGRVSPLRFLGALLCLDTKAACGAPLRMDAIALHPLSIGDPDRPARENDDLALADLEPKLGALLDRARRLGRIPAAPVPLWITELNWSSAGGTTGVPAALQAMVVGRAMLRLWQAGAAIVDWQFATDPPAWRTSGTDRPAGLTTTLPGDPRSLPGAAKGFLAGFAFPVAAIPLGSDEAWVWAMAPQSAAGAHSALIERRLGSRWVAVAKRPLAKGVLGARVRVPVGSTVRVRIAGALSPGVPVRLRVGRLGAATAAPASLEQPLPQGATGPDPRPFEADGPGFFPSLPPRVWGGTPSAPSGRPIFPEASPVVPARRLIFRGTGGADVIIGTTQADRLIALGGNDLLVGFGGDDRFDAGTGRDTVVRSRTVMDR